MGSPRKEAFLLLCLPVLRLAVGRGALSTLYCFCYLHCSLGQGQKCFHFDAGPQAEGCYMLLYLGSFCAVAVGVCYQLDAGVLHSNVPERGST